MPCSCATALRRRAASAASSVTLPAVLAVPSAPVRIAGMPSAAMKVSRGFAGTWYSNTSITMPIKSPTPVARRK